jgi:hypothetical protein
MANTVIAIKKSGTPSAIPSNLANGELAINYADGKLYYKAANGTIQAIAGTQSNFFGTVNVGGTLIVSDTPNDILTLAAGSNIVLTADPITDTITISATGASGNGGNGGASVTTSDTAPLAPGNGDLWWNTDQLKMFIYYNDGSSAQWIETAPSYIYSLADIIASAAFDTANASFTKANNALANTANVTTAGGLIVPGVLSAKTIAIDPTANVSVSANGQLAWNFDEQTLDLMVDGSGQGTVLQIGQEIYYRVKNQTGNTIPNGTVVMAAGTLGASGRLLVTPAIANGTYPSKYVMGLTTQDIADGADGFVTAFGKVRGLNTSLFNEGDVLYADPAVPGGLTNVMPTAPNTKTTVAICIHQNTTSGVLFIRPTYGSKLNEDELVELGTLANNDVLVYIAANNRFENRSQVTLVPYVHANAAYNQANAAYVLANTGVGAVAAFNQANAAYTQANAAYAAANNAVTDYSPAFIQANTARSHANSAYDQANIAYSQANTVYAQANAAYSQANLVYAQANAAYVKANSSVNTFVGLTDVPSSYANAANYFVTVNASGTGLQFIKDITIDELVHTARVAPTTVANDSVTVYVTATGTSPNREVAYKIKNEYGEEVIISSILT